MIEHLLLTERNGLLPHPITYSQVNPSTHPISAQELQIHGFKKIQYYWLHIPTGLINASILWVRTEQYANLLIELWNNIGGLTWKYSLVPFSVGDNSDHKKDIPEEKRMKIENWAVIFPPSVSPYTPPELLKQSLQGEIFGHPKFNDGKRITTSSIVGKNSRNEILTHSGSIYELGQIDPAYEAQFPDAKNKLLSSLPLPHCLAESTKTVFKRVINMGYKVYKLQNTSGFSSEKPSIIIQKGDPGWEIAYNKWLRGENPTDSELWKYGIFACTKRK
jgi:hypothetical protein